MSKQSILTQVYWPEECKESHGYIIGWAIRGFVTCVIAVLDRPFESLEKAISKIGQGIEILGEVENTQPESQEVADKKAWRDLWYTGCYKEGHIELNNLHCCGYRYKINSLIIYYSKNFIQEHPCNFISPEPMTIEDMLGSVPHATYELSPFQLITQHINSSAMAEQRLLQELNILEDKIKFYEGGSHKLSPMMVLIRIILSFILGLYN